MKNFFETIIDLFKYILKFLFILSLVFLIGMFIFSLKSNISFRDSITYFKEIIIPTSSSNTTSNILVNNNIENNNPTTIILNNSYYYDQLDDTGKTLYDSLENNIDNLKKDNYTIDFSTKFNNLLNETTGQYQLNKAFHSAIDAFFYDHPELFYIDIRKFQLNTKCMSIGPLKTYTVSISPQNGTNYLSDHFKSEYEVNTAIAKVENVRKNILDSVHSKNNTYDKIKEVHDILVKSIEYDSTYSAKHAYDIYGALVENIVVCEGYAKAFKYLMDSLGFECILVIGDAITPSYETESHMWNYVKLDGSWYGVDVTWDDPVFIGGKGDNVTRRNYLLKGDSTFSDSHFPSGKRSESGMRFTLPTLSNTNYKW